MLAVIQPGWTAPPPASAAKPVAAAVKHLPDATIESGIRFRFQKSKIRSEGFSVKVQGGVAIIEGKTNVIQRKGVATRLAKLAGARAVDNRIQIDPAARERAAANLAKGRRRAQVKRGEVRTETSARAVVSEPKKR